MPSNFNASGSIVFVSTIASLVFYLSVDRVCNMFETLAQYKYGLGEEDDYNSDSDSESEKESDSEIDESDIY